MNKALLVLLVLLVPCVLAHSTSDAPSVRLMAIPDQDPVVNTSTGWYLFLLNESSGKAMNGLELQHERELHVFIVSEDFKSFAHIHPEDFFDGMERSAQGYYHVNYTFPVGGRYNFITSTSLGGQGMLKMYPAYVRGEPKQRVLPLNPAKTKQFGEYTVSLRTESLTAGEISEFSYYILRNGTEVRDLQLYLGTELHLLVVESQFLSFDHLHPFIPGHGLHYGVMIQRYSGPSIPVRYNFTTPGTYVMYGQFQHEGKVVTTDFAVTVGSAKSVVVPASYPLRNILLFSALALAVLIGVWYVAQRK